MRSPWCLLQRQERSLKWWQPWLCEGKKLLGRGTGGCLLLPLRTPVPSSTLIPPHTTPSPTLSDSYCQEHLWLLSPEPREAWGVLGSACGSGRGGLPSHRAFGTNIGPYFSRVGGVCVHLVGFGSRHVCSEQVGRASLPAGNSGMCLFGLHAESCEIPVSSGWGRLDGGVGTYQRAWWPRFLYI